MSRQTIQLQLCNKDWKPKTKTKGNEAISPCESTCGHVQLEADQTGQQGVAPGAEHWGIVKYFMELSGSPMMKALNDEFPGGMACFASCGVNCEHSDMCEVLNSFVKWVTFNEDVCF